ncbi:MAG: TonB-dependent receptor [Flavobacteriales bacterium]|nr:TonB-dependent receptor [Flavobacteriales bacterium]
MRRLFIVLVYLFLYVPAFCQTDTTEYDLKEYTISGFQDNRSKTTSLNIEPYSLTKLSEEMPFNLSDALSKIPGISQMTTGNAISKPVIRGLYGNRILIVLSGLRFDNQQWQDEHGLGLSQIGIDRIEVIKGPSALLYGSEAMGGVINVIEEKPSNQGRHVDAGIQLFSNSLGHLVNAGISKKHKAKYWRIRLGNESHSDYSDGSGNRVLNSRNDGYYLKAGIGFSGKKWKQENSYNFSYNQYGFIINELRDFFDEDARWSRKMSGPHHIVLLNLINSQNVFLLNKSILKLNVGFQSNSRREDEGGGQISLNMHLLSVLENLRWEKKLGRKTTIVVSEQFSFVNNTNYGGRILVPDANMFEDHLTAYLKYKMRKSILEIGGGLNHKNIKTFVTRDLNSPGQIIMPFERNNFNLNGMLGYVYNPLQNITIKSNLASGFRSPNLAELSSNGLHEGVYRYEIGDPDLKTEQNFNIDLSVELNKKRRFLSFSVFANKFNKYIYLSPTDEMYFGFPVFRYKQKDALLYGGEVLMNYVPRKIKRLSWKESFSWTKGELSNGENLPFIPAFKLSSSLRYSLKINRKWSAGFVEPEFVYLFRQDNPAIFETSTPSYLLVNLKSSVSKKGRSGNWHLGININNLTNKRYYDHLSRLKYYGLYNQGVNFVISIKKELSQ